MPLNQELSYMKDAWAEFADIDLEQFYVNTMPDIVVEHCLFDSLDCREGTAKFIMRYCRAEIRKWSKLQYKEDTKLK